MSRYNGCVRRHANLGTSKEIVLLLLCRREQKAHRQHRCADAEIDEICKVLLSLKLSHANELPIRAMRRGPKPIKSTQNDALWAVESVAPDRTDADYQVFLRLLL